VTENFSATMSITQPVQQLEFLYENIMRGLFSKMKRHL